MVLNDADADDLAQEVFVRVIRGLGGFRAKAKFSTWLHATTVNAVRSFLGRPRDQGASDDVIETQVDGRHDGPEAAALAGELDGEIAAALGSLAPHLRSAIALVAIQGVPVREAARLEGCGVPMYWRVHKARSSSASGWRSIWAKGKGYD